MEPLFLGSHTAIDFLNTSFAPDGVSTELIGDGAAYIDWLVGAGLIAKVEAAALIRETSIRSLDGAAAEARKTREWLRQWLARWREHPNADYKRDLSALNKLLARDSQRQELSLREGSLALVTVPKVDDVKALLGLIAVEVAQLMVEEQPELVKSCAADDCTLWFLDRTKSHRRIYCSPAVCGNRAKVAAFRERQRG